MKKLLIYESYAAKFYGHEPLGVAKVLNKVSAIDLWRQLVLIDGYSRDLIVVEEKRNTK